MADPEKWSTADDAALRRALDVLRQEVETVPLADVRFVKARGNARRRRSLLVATAAAAAAVVALGVVGIQTLGQRNATVPPAATTSSPPAPTKSTTPNPVVPLDVPGLLPVAAEWQHAFGIAETMIMGPLDAGEPVFSDCPTRMPGEPVAAQSVHAESAGFDASQGTYRAATAEAADAAADRAVSDLTGCTTMKVRAVADSAWPKIYQTAVDAGVTWYVVAHSGRGTSLLSITEPGSSTARYTVEQVQALASVAQRRLARDGQVPAGGQDATSPTGTAAANEDMPVAGTRPLLSSDLFVAASQWSSRLLSQGHPTHAVTTDFEGSAMLHDCDVDIAMDQTPQAGRFGIVAVADQVDGTFLGKQRVRLMGSADAAGAEARRLTGGIASCPSRSPGTTVSSDPAHPGVFRLVSASTGNEPVTTWVAVQVNAHTPQAVTTLYVRSPMTDGFAELDRLLGLALQK